MTPEELLGRSLLGGEYVLQEVLGQGGMATVYRAYCRSLGTDVAVKVLAPRLAQDPDFRERFHDEARSLAPLHHPNLIEVHRYGEEGDLVFIAMRLVAGGTLKQLVQAMQAPLDTVTTARLISQVADALQLAHEDNLIHLDIKPANILLGRHDWPLWPLLTDFGITQAIQHQETQRGGERLAGTPLYMSPEQCVGGQIDGRSDEYSLAVTTFELLTGHMPFMAETTELLLQRHAVEPPPRVREVNPAVPGPVEEVVLRGLAKSPDDRYPTVKEFGAALSAAAERTRGVSLATKTALSGIAPNLIGAVALLVIGPLLLTLLPQGVLLGGRLPLVWPFQFVLGLMLVGLLWGIRWHVIGLLARATNSVLDAVLLAGGSGVGTRDASTGLRVKSWRNAIVGSVEGIVSLGYLAVFYRLLAVPALTILATLVPGPLYQGISLAVAVVLVVVAAGIVVAIYRASGPAIAGLILAAGWALTTALPSSALAGVGGTTTVDLVRLAVGAVILVAVLAVRRSTQPIVARAALAALGPVLAVAQPGANADQVAAGRRRIGQLTEGILDVGYLLLGYALLQASLVATLGAPLGMVTAAIIVTGIAAVIWAFLTLRLHGIAGTPGAALGLVLGAPLLTSLPLFQPQTFGLDWPATVAAWGVAVALILLIAVIHSQVQTVGQHALGPMLDRGLAGTLAAPDEAKADRRARALDDLARALVDVLLLVVVYWVVGLPAVATLSQASGRRDLGTLMLLGVVFIVIALLAGPLRRALLALDETGGGSWGRRFAAVPALALGAAALLVGGCAAVPVLLTSPAAVGDFALAPSQAPVVLVDWQHYVPWTPTQDQAAYAISLSCSDGRALGVFEEAFRPATGGAMPWGNVGTLGRTQTACSDWESYYFSLRQSAGLPAQSSVSWDDVDVRAALQPDGSADVVETHRVLFTNGTYASLIWPEATGGSAGKLTNVGVAEGSTPYTSGPAGSGGSYRVEASNGQDQIGWSFAPVASPAVRTYTIHYKLDGAIENVEGGQQFAREVLLPNRAGPVWQITVEVTLPSTPASPAQLSSSGAPTRNGLIDPRTAWFVAQNVAPGNTLDVVVKIPGGLGQSGGIAAVGQSSSSAQSGSASTGSNGVTSGAAGGSGGAAGGASNGTSLPTSVLAATAAASSGNGAGSSGNGAVSSGSGDGSSANGDGSSASGAGSSGDGGSSSGTGAGSSGSGTDSTGGGTGSGGNGSAGPGGTPLMGTPLTGTPPADLTAVAIVTFQETAIASETASAAQTATAVASGTTNPGADVSVTATPSPTPTLTSGTGTPSSATSNGTPTPTPTLSSPLGPTNTPSSGGGSGGSSGGGSGSGGGGSGGGGGGAGGSSTSTSTPTATFTRTPTATATNTPIPPPTIALQSGSVAPQSPLGISGSHFGANRAINFSIDGNGLGTYGISTNCQTDGAGSFACSFVLPPLLGGNHTVAASDGTHSVSASFTAVGTFTLNPTQGFDGTSVTATGYGFGANVAISFTFSDASTSKKVAPNQCTSAANGSFTCDFHVPVGSTNGTIGTTYTVTASDGSNSATAVFTVFKQ